MNSFRSFRFDIGIYLLIMCYCMCLHYCIVFYSNNISGCTFSQHHYVNLKEIIIFYLHAASKSEKSILNSNSLTNQQPFEIVLKLSLASLFVKLFCQATLAQTSSKNQGLRKVDMIIYISQTISIHALASNLICRFEI